MEIRRERLSQSYRNTLIFNDLDSELSCIDSFGRPNSVNNGGGSLKPSKGEHHPKNELTHNEWVNSMKTPDSILCARCVV